MPEDEIKQKPSTLLDISTQKKAVERFNSVFSVHERPTGLDLLSVILTHFSNFPYENISKIIKYHHHFEGVQKIRLPREIMEDHVQYHLGGTCFSLTYFLEAILTHHGYLCYPAMADMRWGKNVHCVLVVELDKRKYLVDPGYLLNQPMELSADKPRLFKTEFTGVELNFHDGGAVIDVYTFDKTGKRWRYRFVDRPVSIETFLMHWLASFQWNSMHGLCLTRVEKDRLIYIHKTFMRETTFGQKKNYNIKNTLHASIQGIFGIDSKLVEEALTAIESNMARERELGLWKPKDKRKNG